MMPERSRAAVRRDAGGFILVGVAMFIIVLTILGLSLFSLSSIESQFFDRSYRGSRAFYEALGGVDRARWVLLQTDSMFNVTQSLPPGVQAVAYQDKGGGFIDSVGHIQWGGTDDVHIRVTSTKGDIRQTVQAQFMPSRKTDLYMRLMTLSGLGGSPDSALVVKRDNGVSDVRWTQTLLAGKVWQNPPNKSALCDRYLNYNLIPDPIIWMPQGGVPDPEVQAYVDAYWPSAHSESPNALSFDLDAQSWPDRVGFFRTASGGQNWSILIGQKSGADTFDVDITVHGTVVWMFDRGFQCARMVRVHGSGSPEDLLVLVALPGLDTPHRGSGFALFAGLDSPNVPIIMVSSRQIKLQDFQAPGPGTSTNVSYLSMYAQSAEIMGPTLTHPTVLMTLVHAPNAPQDQPGGAVNRMIQLGLLPNLIAGENRDLPMRPGTWHQVAQNN